MIPEFLLITPILLVISLSCRSIQAHKIIILQDLSFPSITEVVQEYEKTKGLEKIPKRSLAVLNAYYYAKLHGYEYRQFTVDEDYLNNHLGFHRSWLKLFAVYEYLIKGYDYVCYLDAKYYFSQPFTSLTQQIEESWTLDAEGFMLNDEEEIVEIPSLPDPSPSTDMQTNFMLFKNTSDIIKALDQWIVIDRSIGNKYKSSPPFELVSLHNYIASMQLDDRLCIISIPQSFYQDFLLDKSLEQEIFIFKTEYSQNLHSLVQSQMEIFQSQQFELSEESQESSKTASLLSDFNNTELVTILNNFNFYEWTPDYWIKIEVPFFNVATMENVNIPFQSHVQDGHFHKIKLQCEQLQIDCSAIIDRLKEERKIRQELIRQKFTRLWINETFPKNPKFLSFLPSILQQNIIPYEGCNDSFPKLQLLSHNHDSFILKTIITIFAGRNDRLSIVMKYLLLAKQLNIIQEIHLWDYCREEDDQTTLYEKYDHREDEGIFIRQKYTSRMFWADYYEFYDNYTESHPDDVIIKCDDDIIFMDIFQLQGFIHALRDNEETINGVLFPNIVNNGVAAYYQQKKLKMIPEAVNDSDGGHGWIDDYEYPTFGLCGSLWESGEKANRLHDYFLAHWESLIRPAHPYEPEVFPICTRFSINFFGVKGRNWYKLRDVGVDDELHISVSLPQYNVMRNYMYTNLIVSHLSFGSQKEGLDIDEKLRGYEELFGVYVRRFVD